MFGQTIHAAGIALMSSQSPLDISIEIFLSGKILWIYILLRMKNASMCKALLLTHSGMQVLSRTFHRALEIAVASQTVSEARFGFSKPEVVGDAYVVNIAKKLIFSAKNISWFSKLPNLRCVAEHSQTHF